MRYTLLSFLCFITLIAYIQRSAMNGATKAVEDDLGISSTDLGYVMSAWYLFYSLFQLPGGWVADRLGSKPALLFFAVGWSALTGLAGLAAGLVAPPAGAVSVATDAGEATACWGAEAEQASTSAIAALAKASVCEREGRK